MKSSEITETMQFNISEHRKVIPADFIPKYFFFQFEWQIEIDDNKSLNIIKGQTFVIENLL